MGQTVLDAGSPVSQRAIASGRLKMQIHRGVSPIRYQAKGISCGQIPAEISPLPTHVARLVCRLFARLVGRAFG